MSGLALDHAYRYASPSEAVPTPGGLGLRLATCSGEPEHAHFFAEGAPSVGPCKHVLVVQITRGGAG
jgi:hypothetical protein